MGGHQSGSTTRATARRILLAAAVLASFVAAPAVVGAAGEPAISVTPQRVQAGSGGTIGGIVTTVAGAPAAYASLVAERRRYGRFGGDWTEIATLVAGADGRFGIPVPEDAQEVRFRLVSTDPAAPPLTSRSVDVVTPLAVWAVARPSVLRNGRTLTITGRLTDAAGSVRGKELLVQAVAGSHWQSIARVFADRGGRFRWRYRFQRTRADSVYRFRVVAAADTDRWPWPTTVSPQLRVRVRP